MSPFVVNPKQHTSMVVGWFHVQRRKKNIIKSFGPVNRVKTKIRARASYRFCACCAALEMPCSRGNLLIACLGWSYPPKSASPCSIGRAEWSGWPFHFLSHFGRVGNSCKEMEQRIPRLLLFSSPRLRGGFQVCVRFLCNFRPWTKKKSCPTQKRGSFSIVRHRRNFSDGFLLYPRTARDPWKLLTKRNKLATKDRLFYVPSDVVASRFRHVTNAAL